MFTTLVAVGVTLAMVGVALGSFGRAQRLAVTSADEQPGALTVASPPEVVVPVWEVDQLVDAWRRELHHIDRRRRARRHRRSSPSRPATAARVIAELRDAHNRLMTS